MRAVDPALAAHVRGRATRVIQLVWLDFAGDPLFAHTDVGEIAWDAKLPAPNAGVKAWTGTGDLGEIDAVDEDASLSPDSYSLALGGLDDDLLGHLRSLDHLGRECRIWVGARNLVTGALVGEPLPVFRGSIDDATISGGGQDGAVALRVTDERAMLGRGAGILFSHAQQSRRRPGDGFFKRAAAVAREEATWGPSDAPRGIRQTSQPVPDDERRYGADPLQ